MYAVIESGGKQYRVEEGDIVEVELLNKEKGASVEFSQILFAHDENLIEIGQPSLANCVVKGEVIGKALGPKVIGVKYKRRKNQRTKWGHRQQYLRVKITEVALKKPGKGKKEEKEVVEKKPVPQKKAAEAKIEKKPVPKKKVTEAKTEKKVKAATTRKAKPKAEKKATPVKKRIVKKKEK